MRSFENCQAVLQFLSELEEIPWFENVGKQLQRTGEVHQISSWEEWEGPEKESVKAIHEAQQKFYLDLTKNESVTAMLELWQPIQSVVFKIAKKKIPYKADQDTWYAPNMAIWHAAWTAGLIGLCLFEERLIPEDVEKQWIWFVSGHWPCDWNGDSMTIVIY